MTVSKPSKKQLKITKLFRKGYKRPPRIPENDEDDELRQEIEELEKKLREKQDHLFQLQREGYRHQLTLPKRKLNDSFNTIAFVVQNRIDSAQRTLEMTMMLTGMEVVSCGPDHCTVIFHMQLDSGDVKHGVTISVVNDVHEITNYSLPLGFNLQTLLDECNNEVSLKTFDIIKKALTAYYSRLEQYEELRTFLCIDGTLFKLMDGTQIEITFLVTNELDVENEPNENLTFILYYTMYDIRPKNYAFKGLTDKPQEALREQFLLFKKFPLTKAFRMAFIDGDGIYKIVRLVDRPLAGPRRAARPKPRAHNDDTFHPEDCSDSSDEEN